MTPWYICSLVLGYDIFNPTDEGIHLGIYRCCTHRSTWNNSPRNDSNEFRFATVEDQWTARVALKCIKFTNGFPWK